MQPGCWLQASQPAGAEAAAGVGVGVATAASSEYMQSTASVATLASISSIASTSASAMAALRARPYLVAPYVATASAPPTPQPHGVALNPMSSTRTAPATPTRRREDHESDQENKRFYSQDGDDNDMQELGLAVALDEPQYCKSKSQRFFWRKALRRVFQRRK